MEGRDLTVSHFSNLVGGIVCVYLFYTFLSLLHKNYIVPYRSIKNTGVNYTVPMPFVGNGLEYSTGERYRAQIERQKKYGKVYATLFFTIPIIWIGDPELLKEILIKDFSNFSNRYITVMLPWPVNKTLLQLRDNDWKRVRNVMTPTFSALKIKSIMPFINEAGDVLLERLMKANEEGKVIDMWRTCGRFTMQVIFATAFGIEFESEEQESKLTNAAAAVFNGSSKLSRILTLLLPRIGSLLGSNVATAMQYLAEITRNVIRERRQNLKQGIACRRDILQQMIEAGDNNRMGDDEIISQAVLFLVAGYDTTANTLGFASYLLATNPDIQQKLIDEVDANCPDASCIDYDTVISLPYLDMVIHETLRMYPAAFFFNRAVKEDTTIKGIHISKDMMIILPIYALHHNPDFWPNPEKFNPERFSPKEKAKHHACSYLPFGGGPRSCIGMRLALLEAKIALIKALQNFELITVEETEIPLKIRSGDTLRPENGVYVGIKKRH